MKKLPVYKLRITESDVDKSEVEYIALVDEPAIMSNWLAFEKQVKFSADNDRRLIMGLAMTASLPIYRNDPDKGEHYVVFDKEEIMKIVQKFFRKGYNNHFNLNHDSQQKTSGLYIIESMIVDQSRGVIAPKAFEGISDGSWIITVKVDDNDVWENFIKTGEVKGFSVEGLFSYDSVMETDEEVLKEIIEIINSL